METRFDKVSNLEKAMEKFMATEETEALIKHMKTPVELEKEVF